MRCPSCGVENQDGAQFCGQCATNLASMPAMQQAPAQQPMYMPPGYQPSGYGMYPPPPAYPQPAYGYVQPPGNGMGVAGFVLGLLGLLLFWIPFLGLVMAILGVSLGGAGIASGRRRGAPTGLAIAGLVLGGVALIPTVMFLLAMAGLWRF